MNHNGDSHAKRHPEAVAAGDSLATGRALHPTRVRGRALAGTLPRTAPPEDRSMAHMRIIKGTPVAPGLPLGPVHVVRAGPHGVPTRIPEATLGGAGSKGIAFLFNTIPAASARASASLPVTPTPCRSCSDRWVSVPPVVGRMPCSPSSVARMAALRTTCAKSNALPSAS